MIRVSAGPTRTPDRRAPRATGAAPLLAVVAAVVAVATLPAAAQDAAPRPPAEPPPPPEIRMPLKDLIVLRVDGGRLTFGTRMTFTGNDPRPVDVQGLPGTTKVLYRPIRFLLDNAHDDEAGAHVTLHLDRRRTYFRLERSVTVGDDAQSVALSVTLSQGLSEDDGSRFRPGRVRLTVEIRGEVKENVDGDDFAALRREHPRPFYKYLLPVLRELGAEGVVAVDPWVARQALADPVPPDRLPGVVDGLVRELGDPSPKVRERASIALAALGPEGLAELKNVKRDGLSPQQATAVDVLLKRHEPAPRADTDRLRDDVDFLFDCLYCAERDVPAAALKRLKEVTGRDLPVDLTGKPGERFQAVEALRAEVAPATVAPTTMPATKPAG